MDIASMTTLVALLNSIGTWPLLTTIVAVILGPWVAVFILNGRQEKRHAEVVGMYQANVALVDDYEEMHTRAGCREESLLDLVRLNTQTLSELLGWLKHRPRCHDLKEG